jgi:hypothetical protein
MLGPTDEVPRPQMATYVPKAARQGTSSRKNEAAKQASALLRNHRALVDPKLSADLELVTKESIYLPNFFADSSDLSLLSALVEDLKRHHAGMVSWSKHLKHENPDFSPTFLNIIQKMQV